MLPYIVTIVGGENDGEGSFKIIEILTRNDANFWTFWIFGLPTHSNLNPFRIKKGVFVTILLRITAYFVFSTTTSNNIEYVNKMYRRACKSSFKGIKTDSK